MKEKLFLIGGGGHCHSCIDVIEAEGRFEIVGVFDLPENIGKKILGYPVIDYDENLPQYFHLTRNVLLTMGQIKNPDLRIRKFQDLIKIGAEFVTVVSPRAYVSSYAFLGKGTIVMHDSVVNSNALVLDNCILNTKSLIEHDAKIGSHTHIATGAIVNGGAHVGEGCFVGSNSVVRQSISVTSYTVIPASSFYKGKLE